MIASLPAGAAPIAATGPAPVIVALLALRWLAGIADNWGVGWLSEASAVAGLTVLGLLFLMHMRLAREASLLVAGLLGWIGIGSLSALATPLPRPAEAAALLVLLLFYALFANAAFLWLRKSAALPLLRGFLTAFVVIGVGLSLWQVLSGSGFVEPTQPDIIRAYGSDVHPVSFALQMLAALLALEVLRVRAGRGFGAIHAALILAGAVAIYLTFARTAWVMAAFVLVLLVWQRGRRLHRLGLVALLLPALVVGLTASDRFADLASLPAFWQNFSFAETVFDYRYIDNSLSWRIVNWSYGLHQAMERPLLGFGPGQSAVASQFSLEMHNILLEGLFEGGLPGLAAVLATLAGLARIHLRLPRAPDAQAHARVLANGYGLALLSAVLLSTSLVDQLMTVLLYLVLLAVAGLPEEPSARPDRPSWLPPSGSP